MPYPGVFTIEVKPVDAGKRLDTLIASKFTPLSRSHAASLIQDELIIVRGAVKKAGYRVKAGDRISGTIPPPQPIRIEPEPIQLEILFEDRHLIVINKQSGLVVHPAAGHASGTLVNGLLYYCPDLGSIGGEIRPGIVHRLDKDTTGVLVVAKNAASQAHLAEQFASRSLCKTYQALVYGIPEADTGIITHPIGRHPVDRKRMSISGRGKVRAAETRWHIRERFSGLACLELDLKTGRTHQARVHCDAIGHPVVGDPVYGSRKSGRGLSRDGTALVRSADRQMLHAWRLELNHPLSGKRMVFTAPLAEDMARLMEGLRKLEQ